MDNFNGSTSRFSEKSMGNPLLVLVQNEILEQQFGLHKIVSITVYST